MKQVKNLANSIDDTIQVLAIEDLYDEQLKNIINPNPIKISESKYPVYNAVGCGGKGGLIQLVAYGAQDIYLTANPKITFFNSNYKKTTNYAIEKEPTDNFYEYYTSNEAPNDIKTGSDSADGINVYNFALHPESHEPSGSYNHSYIDQYL